MFSLQSITSQSRAVAQFLNKNQSENLSTNSKNSIYDQYFGTTSKNKSNTSTISQLNSNLYNQFSYQSTKLDASMAQISSGLSLLEFGSDTAEKISSNLSSLKEIALKASSETIIGDERGSLQLQASELQLKIKSQVSEANYDGQKILTSNTLIEIQYQSTTSSSTYIKTQNLQEQLEKDGLSSLDFSNADSSKSSLNQIQKMINKATNTQSFFEKQSKKLTGSFAGLQANASKLNALKTYFTESSSDNSFTNQLKNQFNASSLLAYRAQANISSSQMMKIFSSRTI